MRDSRLPIPCLLAVVLLSTSCFDADVRHYVEVDSNCSDCCQDTKFVISYTMGIDEENPENLEYQPHKAISPGQTTTIKTRYDEDFYLRIQLDNTNAPQAAKCGSCIDWWFDESTVTGSEEDVVDYWVMRHDFNGSDMHLNLSCSSLEMASFR
jgi:hypothetical protein